MAAFAAKMLPNSTTGNRADPWADSPIDCVNRLAEVVGLGLEIATSSQMALLIKFAVCRLCAFMAHKDGIL